MALTKEQSDAIKAKFKKNVTFDDPDSDTTFVFRKPYRREWYEFQRDSAEDRPKALEKLAKACLVFPETRPDVPDVEKLDDVIDEYPAVLSGMLFLHLADLAGGAITAGKA